VTFSNVTLFPASAQSITRILRVTNVRLDASALGSGSQLVAFASISGAALSMANPQQIVAFADSAQTFSASASGACTGVQGTFVFAETSVAQFKTRGTGLSTPGTSDSNTESGFVPVPAIAGVGLADSGTQLSATFVGLPDGAQITVPATATNGSLQVAAISPTGGGTVPSAGGTATIVYEVTASTAAVNESISIPFAVSGTNGNFSIEGSLAPVSLVTAASDSAPIPRFAGQAMTSTIAVAACAPPPTPAPATSRYTLALLTLLLMLVAAVRSRAAR
jgi:hypothetical protein